MKKREAIKDQGICHVLNKSGARAPFTATYFFENEEQAKIGTETWYLLEKEEQEKRGTERKTRALKKTGYLLNITHVPNFLQDITDIILGTWGSDLKYNPEITVSFFPQYHFSFTF